MLFGYSFEKLSELSLRSELSTNVLPLVFEVIEVSGVNEVIDKCSAACVARQSIVDNFERSDNFVNFFNF